MCGSWLQHESRERSVQADQQGDSEDQDDHGNPEMAVGKDRKAYISGMNPLSFVTIFAFGELGTMGVLAAVLHGSGMSLGAELHALSPSMLWLFLGGFCWVLGDFFQQHATKCSCWPSLSGVDGCSGENPGSADEGLPGAPYSVVGECAPVHLASHCVVNLLLDG